ncbi:dTDP-4-dehydrorhamnose reductase [Pseudonocardia hierapolitana]|uniref:dTDP-4-dehydrorhamnose reductase n=1 Tax=Pseudonocardia hierapolitana TaxID=1128676 RepID=A0A561SZQ1_9PSEU|nr:NAD(P)-dependent oxidoreductase [Pseudonocardia hierapolitana]TWF80305.1 dTDP-4-dehydrorhamnose reductase [Pseudonocardia hierapolitana]
MIVGAAGRVGSSLARSFPEATCLKRGDLDVGDPCTVARFGWSRDDVVLNAAGYTDVDAAQSRAGSAAAWRTNHVGAANLAQAAIRHRFVLLHLSTDYVFSGRTTGAISEDAPVDPLNVYGESKAAGDSEVARTPRHYIVRTSWVVGEGENFVRRMLRLAHAGQRPTIVDDQFGRLTFADDLCAAIRHLVVHRPAFGTYNVTNDGTPATWAAIARKVFIAAGRRDEDVSGRTTREFLAEFPKKAERPLNSVLDLGKARGVGIELHDWEPRLKEYLERELTR